MVFRKKNKKIFKNYIGNYKDDDFNKSRELEFKLKNVRDKVKDELLKKEYTMDEYYDLTLSLLGEQGILHGDLKSVENERMNTKIATRISYIVNADKYYVSDEKFITLKETFENGVGSFSNLENNLKKHIVEEFGKNSIYKKDFESCIDNYFESKFESNYEMDKLKYRLNNKLKYNFNIIDNPSMIGDYNLDEFDNSLDKLNN